MEFLFTKVLEQSGLEFTRLPANDVETYRADIERFQLLIRLRISGLAIELRGPHDLIKVISLLEGGSNREDSVYYPWSGNAAKTLSVALARIEDLEKIAVKYSNSDFHKTSKNIIK